MDLNQRNLSKSEWESIEVPVSNEEKEILELIIKSYKDVNFKYNKHNSLFGYLKIEYSIQMEDHLYNKYFSAKIGEIKKLAENKDIFEINVKSNPSIKKADLIRIEQNDLSKLSSYNIYELLLIEIVEKFLKYNTKLNISRSSNSHKKIFYYFTLFKLVKNNVLNINRHIKNIIHNLLTHFENDIPMEALIENAVHFIEKNQYLLKYSDISLYIHQKDLFTIMKNNNNPKLVLYTAPTGTGKTLSPIGLSEQFKIIFVCAARHVGLALARSAISVNKKIAFAFGCSSAADIRLHYFAAKDYTTNKKTGQIKKVDNSVGDKVEIMICDLISFLPAMYYMKAFNPVENIVVYWDEPTITMDYENHDLHQIIKRNWSENLIPNMILSSATLPKLYELSDTIENFKCKFGLENTEIFNIVSNDCKKSIPVVDKSGYVVLPHYMSEDYDSILQIVSHIENNYTLLRYFDLNEVILFILFVESNNYIQNIYKINRNFASLNDVNMLDIKLHYLKVLKNIKEGTWGAIYVSFKSKKTKYILPNNTIDTKGNKITKSVSVGPGTFIGNNANTLFNEDTQFGGKPISKLKSCQELTNTGVSPETEPRSVSCLKELDNDNCAIYVTTKDAYTLTDGPTLFLAEDVEKIAKFMLQQANIPAHVMKDILSKIEFNNNINSKIESLEKDLQDLEEKNTMKNDSSEGVSTKKKNHFGKEIGKEYKSEFHKLTTELDMYRSMIKTAELNETFIPNKLLHFKKWAEDIGDFSKAFTSNIDESTIIEIMLLNDVVDSWKVLLLMGIGVFTNHKSIAYTEIMKKLADQQRLYIIIASSDYIYGTNYQFCHGYISKDLCLTQEKIIQALGRVGRNNIQQSYSIRFRDNAHILKLFYPEENKIEVRNMNLLFS